MSADGASADRLPRDELRLRLYELLEHRLEKERQWRLVRTAGGGVVIGGIIGFALLTEQLQIIALTPVLFGIAVMAGLKSTVDMLYLQRHMVQLEREFQDREPLFAWMSDYGVFGGAQAIEFEEVDLNVIPNTALAVLIASIYVILMVIGYWTWAPITDSSVFLGGSIGRGILVIGYVTFTALVVVIAVVGYLHYQRISNQLAV